MKLARVAILEDDQFTLVTLKQALTGLNIDIQCATSQIPIAIEAVRTKVIDVAILDLDLGPGASGIDVAYAMRKLNPSIGIILLTSYLDPRLADPSGRNCPPGTIFLTKSILTEFSSLVTAILTAKNFPLKTRKQENQKLEITNRQIEVLKLLASGYSTLEISKTIGVTEKTVEAIITKLHSTLNLDKDKKFNIRIQLARAYFVLSGRTPPGD